MMIFHHYPKTCVHASRHDSKLASLSHQNIMPISAAMFRSERNNPVPQCPPRLDVQMLTPVIWSRMPNHFLNPEVGKVSERLGWMVECTEPLTMMALHIPEENRSETQVNDLCPSPVQSVTRSSLCFVHRCIDILELSERLDLMKFHYHTLMLYCAVCALGNNRVAHALCSHVDESQLFYAIENTYLPGPLRSGYYDLLISIHLESAKRARLGTNKEFIVPMTEETLSINLYPDIKKAHSLPGVGLTTCLRPKLHFSSINFVGTDPDLYTLSPVFPLQVGQKSVSFCCFLITFLITFASTGAEIQGHQHVNRGCAGWKPGNAGSSRRQCRVPFCPDPEADQHTAHYGHLQR